MTSYELPVLEDTYLSKLSPDQIFSGSKELKLAWSKTDNGVYDGQPTEEAIILMKFDLPALETVDKAILRIKALEAVDIEDETYFWVYVRTLDSSLWTEELANYVSLKPSISDTNLGYEASFNSEDTPYPQYVDIDVTELVKTQNGNEKITLVLQCYFWLEPDEAYYTVAGRESGEGATLFITDHVADPEEVITRYIEDDTYVSYASKSGVFGFNNNIILVTQSGTNTYGLLKFDISDFYNITSCKLRLLESYAMSPTATHTISIKRTPSDWIEDTENYTTWSNVTDSIRTLTFAYTPSADGSLFKADITELAKDALEAGEKYLSIMIKIDTYNTRIDFISKQGSYNGLGFTPHLFIAGNQAPEIYIPDTDRKELPQIEVEAFADAFTTSENEDLVWDESYLELRAYEDEDYNLSETELYLMFDPAPLSSIRKATLKLFVEDVVNEAQLEYRTFKVCAFDDFNEENDEYLCYEMYEYWTCPVTAGQRVNIQDCIGKYIEIDITSIMKNAVSENFTDFTMQVKLIDYGAEGDYISFSSSESEHPPIINIAGLEARTGNIRPAIEDGGVWREYEYDNFAKDPNMFVQWDDAGWMRYGFIKFDIRDIPSTAWGILRLYVEKCVTFGGDEDPKGLGIHFEVERVTGSWDEERLTENFVYPDSGVDISTAYPFLWNTLQSQSVPGYVDIDISQILYSAVKNSVKTLSLEIVIGSINSDTTRGYIEFGTREGGKPPMLLWDTPFEEKWSFIYATKNAVSYEKWPNNNFQGFPLDVNRTKSVPYSLIPPVAAEPTYCTLVDLEFNVSSLYALRDLIQSCNVVLPIDYENSFCPIEKLVGIFFSRYSYTNKSWYEDTVTYNTSPAMIDDYNQYPIYNGTDKVLTADCKTLALDPYTCYWYYNPNTNLIVELTPGWEDEDFGIRLYDRNTELDINKPRIAYSVPAAPAEILEGNLTRYVDAVNGSDSNTGTLPGHPWKTLAHAFLYSPPYSTIYVRGSFSEGDIIFSKAPYVILNWDTEPSVIIPSLEGSSTVQLYAIEDTYESQQSPSTIHGSDSAMYIRDGSNSYDLSYVKFDISDLPDGSSISKCILKIPVLECVTEESSIMAYSMMVSGWSEDTLSYNNSTVDYIGDRVVTWRCPKTSSQMVVSADITSLINESISIAGHETFGIYIETEYRLDSDDYYVKFGTKEGGHPAWIEISFK